MSPLDYSDENSYSSKQPRRAVPPIRKVSSKSQNAGFKPKQPPNTQQPSRLSPMSHHGTHVSFHGDVGGTASEGSNYNPPEESSSTPSLVPCPKCGRSFAVERIAKHESICTKTNHTRKVFDSTKMRTQGTEMSKYNRRGMSKPSPSKPQSNWKKNHGE